MTIAQKTAQLMEGLSSEQQAVVQHYLEEMVQQHELSGQTQNPNKPLPRNLYPEKVKKITQ